MVGVVFAARDAPARAFHTPFVPKVCTNPTSQMDLNCAPHDP